jgi:hypothetical protein
MHPNGQLPAYEWNLSDVNPPVHAWSCFRVFKIDEKQNGKPDLLFLEKVFQKLLLNFTWWVNRKDKNGKIFSGRFSGLDNIGAFDRNMVLKDGQHLEQADGTSWMAMYALNMMRIAMELAQYYQVYEDMAIKFLSIIFILLKPWKIWVKAQKDSGMKKTAFSTMCFSLERRQCFSETEKYCRIDSYVCRGNHRSSSVG